MPGLARPYDPDIGPLLQVGFGQAGAIASQSQGQQAPLELHELLVDTGATHTCISPTIIQALGLTPISQVPMTTPSGTSNANMYLVDLVIPFGQVQPTGIFQGQVFHLANIQVIEFNGDTQHYQGLLGRNVLCLGHLSISFDRTFRFFL